MKKRLLPIFLVLTMCMGLCAPVFALDVVPVEPTPHTVMDQITAAVPGAEVRVVDNIIHIVVHDLSEVSSLLPIVASPTEKVTSVDSSTGGTFKDFSIPHNPMVIPITQVYMSKAAVDARLIQLSEPVFFDWLLEQIAAGLTASAIVAVAQSVWGISLPISVVTFLVSFSLWGAGNLDYWSLESAQDKSTTGKVAVLDSMTSDGQFSIIYSPWESNVCTTFGGYPAEWYPGEYDL